MNKANNYAFIDSQNLNLSIRELGWHVDWRKFRTYLKEKYGVSKAYLFVGFVEENQAMYDSLAQAGFELVFKPIMTNKDGQVKGNIDAELVLQAMIDYDTYDQAVIVTGDGDFYCLVKYLLEQNKLLKLIIPNRYKYSSLLKEKTVISASHMIFMNDLRKRLQYKRTAPRESEKRSEE
ncbi:NYN domain-containing protein [Candidatus Parcubacteria bacterium]|nr:NYN domain-containing protein [Candidatus Parcubacteria bacterium]